jgi:hypothetical protein
MNDIPPEKKNIVDKTPQWLRLLLFVRLSIVISLGYTSYMAGTPVGFSRAQLKNLGQRSHGACGPKKNRWKCRIFMKAATKLSWDSSAETGSLTKKKKGSACRRINKKRNISPARLTRQY